MAVGNIVGVEPLENGGYNFIDKSGAKKTLFGPDADEFVQKFRKSEELSRGTQPTAQLDQSDLVVPEGGFGGFGGQVPQPKVATDAPAPVPGYITNPRTPEVPAGDEGVPSSIARAEAAPQQESLAQAGAQFSDGKGGTIQQLPDGSWVTVKTTAPSRGGMVEKSRTVAGGFEQSPEYLQATEQSFAGQAGAQAKGAEIAVAEAEIERHFLEQQQRQNVARAEAQRQQIDTIQRGVREKQAEYDMINERYKTQKVDPFRGVGTFQRVMMAVGASLGAFGASITKSPNFAGEMINSYIEQNIREQEREIAVKREQAQNTLADLEKRLGSRDLAKTALGAIMAERFQLQLQAQAGALKAPKAIAAFQDANAKLTQQYADKLEEYRQKAGGQITRSQVNMPGSAGGTTITPVTLEQGHSLKKMYGGDAAKRDPGAVKEERELAVAGENINFMEDRLKRYNDDDKPKLTAKRGFPVRAGHAITDAVFGEDTSQDWYLDDDEKALIQDYESVKNQLQGAMAKASGMGTAMSDSERATVAQGQAPGATVGQLRRALAAAREINARTRQVVKEFGPVPAQEIPTRPVE